MKLDLSLRFAKVRMFISHLQVKSLGSFSMFCMKAISEGLTIEDISEITLLKQELIIEQLKFARQQKYLTEDNQLSDKGRRLVDVLNFLEKYPKGLVFYLDTYTEQKDITAVYKEEELNVFSVGTKNHINQRLKTIMILRLLNEGFSKELHTQIVEHLIPDERDLIEQEKDYLQYDFKIDEFTDFVIPFDLERFMDKISYNQGDIDIFLPVVTFELNVKPAFEDLDREDLSKITELFTNTRRSFNLLDGSPMTQHFQKVTAPTKNKIIKMFDKYKVFNQEEHLNIPMHLLCKIHIKPEVIENYAVAYLKKEDLHHLLNETIRVGGAVT